MKHACDIHQTHRMKNWFWFNFFILQIQNNTYFLHSVTSSLIVHSISTSQLYVYCYEQPVDLPIAFICSNGGGGARGICVTLGELNTGEEGDWYCKYRVFKYKNFSPLTSFETANLFTYSLNFTLASSEKEIILDNYIREELSTDNTQYLHSYLNRSKRPVCYLKFSEEWV